MRNSTIVAVLVVLFLILGGWYYWSMNGGPAMPGFTPVATTPTEEEGVICTMDAMQCPDGSWVGRTGPNCQFVCPTTAPATSVQGSVQGGAGVSGSAAEDPGIGDASAPAPRQ